MNPPQVYMCSPFRFTKKIDYIVQRAPILQPHKGFLLVCLLELMN